MISRRILLSGLFASVASVAGAEVLPRSPRPMMRGDQSQMGTTSGAWPADASNLVQAAKISGGTSYMLLDGKTGAVLESYQPSLQLPPASVAKAVTTLYALETLAPSYRFATRLLATGPIMGGIVQGDLILAGGGDPTLETDQLGQLAAQLAGQGIRGVTGRLLYWEAALPQVSEVAHDQPDYVGYNPAISGLNLNFNRVNFEWKKAGSGWTTIVDARGNKFSPRVSMATVDIVQRQAPIFTYRSTPTQDLWTVASGALGKQGSRWLPVRLPGLYTIEVFRALAQAQGIKLPPGQKTSALPSGQELIRLHSDELTAVSKDMLRHSTNLTAECLGLTSSKAGTLPASGEKMSDWVRQRFGVAPRFIDHSGLSGRSRVSSQEMAQILWQASRDRMGLKPLLRDTVLRDKKGDPIRHNPVKIAAKSGTLNFASGLAGYITQPDGRELVFAIFSGDPERRDAVPVAAREKPPGSGEWLQRARNLQNQLLTRWSALYA